jgi:hypothetical protein
MNARNDLPGPPPTGRKGWFWRLVDMLVFFLMPAVVYLLLCAALGYLALPAGQRLVLLLGYGAAVVVMLLVSLMGESLIEDVVKLVLFSLFAVPMWSIDYPDEPENMARLVQTVILGLPAGAATPIAFRAWHRFVYGPVK